MSSTLRDEDNPTVLAIDTSGAVAAGVCRPGETLAGGVVDDTRAHAEQLMPLVTRVCADAGIELREVGRIVVGLGPGPFTGLRVGIATARTLASVLGVPLHGVCSLDAMAAQVLDPDDRLGAPEFVVAGDARRKEVYWARYDQFRRRIDGPFVGAAAELPDLPVFGPGGALYADELGERYRGGPQQVDGGHLAMIGTSLPDAGVEPLYLRRPDATVPTRRKSTLVVPRPRERGHHERNHERRSS